MNPIDLGGTFTDEDVARLYQFRAPYPRAVFDILERLLAEPRVVLDAGTGTGAIARNLPASVVRIDAIDPSAAMLAHGRALPRGDDPRIRWILGRAEEAALSPPYGLITAGASLHWMRPDDVLPRFHRALAPGARLAVVDTETTHVGAWHPDMLDVIRRYSPLAHHEETHEMVARYAKLGILTLEDEARTDPEPFEQSVDDYLMLLGSTSTLSRVTLGSRAAAFESESRALFARHRMDRVVSNVVGYVAWGRPTGSRGAS